MLIDQDFFEEGYPGSEELFFEDGNVGKNILAIINYSDYSVSRSLQTTIDDWVGTLEKRVSPSWQKFVAKALKGSRGSLPTIASALTVVPLIRFFKPSTIETATNVILIAIFLVLITLGLAKLFTRWMVEKIASIQPITYLLLTGGDSIRKLKIEKTKKQRIATATFFFFLVTIPFVVGTLSSLFATYIGSSN